MEPGGLLSLPEEVLHQIGRFLPVGDILACSATCHYLRGAFNNNIVWKKYLPENMSDLQSIQFVMDPALCVEESLPPLCENRIAFMKKTNILNNWKCAKFIKNSTELSHRCASGVLNVPKTVGQAIYKDCYLFLGRFTNDVESDAVEVWDINKEPVLLMELKMNELYYEHIYIVGDFLVVVECVQVKVYEIRISEKALPLLFSFLIIENEVVFHEPLNHPWKHDFRCVGWNYSMIDHYLFANKCETVSNIRVFHVWDIINSCKVGSFSPPISAICINYHSHLERKWFLQVLDETGKDSYILQFDIESKRFSESVFYIEKHIIYSVAYNSCLILFEPSNFDSEGLHNTVCSVYDFSTSRKLQERCFNDSGRNQITLTKVINGQFVMLCIDGFHVIDALSLETLLKFPDNGICFITHHLNILGSVFILAANSHSTLEVWDIRKRVKTTNNFDNLYQSHFHLNASCSKLACVSHYKILVYDFL